MSLAKARFCSGIGRTVLNKPSSSMPLVGTAHTTRLQSLNILILALRCARALPPNPRNTGVLTSTRKQGTDRKVSEVCQTSTTKEMATPARNVRFKVRCRTYSSIALVSFLYLPKTIASRSADAAALCRSQSPYRELSSLRLSSCASQTQKSTPYGVAE